MTDVLIIGGGPAGMTAAIYARRAGKSVTVLEAEICGGQIVNTPEIENYPAKPHISGLDFADALQAQAEELGAEFVYERAVGIETEGGAKVVVTEEKRYPARSVILATGSENRKLGLPHEARLTGKGISYCATCDGSFFKNRVVAVAGGGNTALEDALFMADIAKTVYLIHRRGAFRGDQKTVEKLKEKPNVVFLYNRRVSALLGEDRLSGVELTDTQDGSVSILELGGLFVAIGRIPENQNFADAVQLDAEGYVLAGEDCHTSAEGIFVAGDNRVKVLRQLVTATADGAMAATEAVKYLNSL